MKKGIVMQATDKWTVVITPEGEFIKIPHQPNHLEGVEVLFSAFETSRQEGKRIWARRLLPAFSIVSACLLFFLIVTPFLGEKETYAAVTIDINPSVEFEINRRTQVIGAEAFNDEGEQLLRNVKWKSQSLGSVTVNVIHQAQMLGYIKDEQQVVITTTYLQEERSENIGQLIEETPLDQELTVLFVEGDEQWRNEAKSQQRSPGFYILEKKAQQANISMTEQSSHQLNVKELQPVEGFKVLEFHPRNDLASVANKKTQKQVKEKKKKEELKKEDKKAKKEKERAEKEQAQKEKERSKKEQEKKEKERAEKEQEKKEKERSKKEQEKKEKERAEKEQEKKEKERAEKEQEKKEKERAEKEQEKKEKERSEKEQAKKEKERSEKEQAKKEKERSKKEQEKKEKERAEKEQEKKEKERSKKEQEKKEKERAEKEQEKKGKERSEKEQAKKEKERAEKEKEKKEKKQDKDEDDEDD
ncbi:hypothetical protein BEP19_14020 [Ammoniphilus oxalaticus]|uniref:RsgI N-terminal anti-sigma domain-containing protein n=1 Tax=Ammoniphilus oxalaticus TaxID=66863 RepID=A0A419SEJ2_9BACL|nr:anti-sigma factor domain-containing protein [Ammoniphilus oxalaticus]RKD21738.1 hypothetical protein BEP19_14020 [Ammoniphilus oxalaticus]